MSIKNKTIYCNRIILYKDVPHESRTENLNLKNGKAYLISCVNEVGYNKIYSFKSHNKIINAEFFKKDKVDNLIIGKLTTSEDSTKYQKRNNKTNEISEIIDNPNEDFESKMFFIIDVENMVVSSVFSMTSPKVKCLVDLFSSISRKNDEIPNNVMMHLSTIGNANMIDNLANSNVITWIETTTFEKPSILKTLPLEKTGFSEKEYENLRESSYIVMTNRLKSGKKGSDVFDENISKEERKSSIRDYFSKFKKGDKNTKVIAHYKQSEFGSFQDAVIYNNPLKYNFSIEVNDYEYNNNNIDTSVTKYDDRLISNLVAQYLLNKDDISNYYEDLD